VNNFPGPFKKNLQELWKSV